MSQDFETFLSTLSRKFTPIIDSSFTKEDFVVLDLSSNNEELDVALLKNPEEHHKHLQEFLKINQAKVAYGGYLEQRKLYDRSDYFQSDKPENTRNIHLGIDLWCEARTAVLCPLDGVVHSFRENTNFGDYGPTIIIEHQIQGAIFYTLFGHLSRESLEGKTVGQKIKSGETIAWLGRPEVNGEYAPHLHFQIIKDLQGMQGDYPGVCSKSKLDYYRNNCPDPNLLLKMY